MNLRPLLSLGTAFVPALGVVSVSALLGRHSGHLKRTAPAKFVCEVIHETVDLDRTVHGSRIDQIPPRFLQSQGERETVGR